MPGITKMPDIFYNSAMPLKQINQAENQLVVGGIKVLGSLEGPGVTSIKQNINSLSTSVQTVGQKQQDYFSSIADDTIITPGEKKTLKKEWNTIQQTYASIIELAKERNLDDTVNFINLKTRYNELYAYLFTKLKVFDNMSENTTIPNTRTFTETYNNYYGQELICQNLLASESGTLVVRQLESLDSPGSPNEIAIHKGQLYRYNDTAAKWEYISTGNYVGILASVPDPIMDNYFLAGVDIVLNHAIKVNGKVLRSSKNKVFQIKKTYKKGLIYIYNENGWTPILDKNDYRYIIATNDLLKIGEDVSPGLESIARQPKYFSTCNTLPEDYKNKDFFVYSGDTKTIQYGDGQETLFIHGELYQFNAPTWTKLESSDPANNQQFMTALTDLLIVHEATEGYFTSVLVKNLIANEAFIKSLATQIITLSQDPNNPGKTGIIQSDNYESSNGETGFRLDYDGNAIFNGNTNISGQLTVTNANITGTSTFSGNIYSGPLELTSDSPESTGLFYPKGFICKITFYGRETILPIINVSSTNMINLENVNVEYGEIKGDRIDFIIEYGNLYYGSQNTPRRDCVFKIKIYNDNELIFEDTSPYAYGHSSCWVSDTRAIEYTLKYDLLNDLKIEPKNSTKTLKLKNLPIGNITEKNIMFAKPVEGTDYFNLCIKL